MVATILYHENDHGHIMMPTTQGMTYGDDEPLPIPLPPHHTAYDEPMATMIAELHAVADTTLVLTYTDPIELSQAIQGLHMPDMLEYDDDGANYIDITRMDPISTNNDYQLGGSEHLQKAFHALIAEFHDIFSYSVKGKAMDVPPKEFTVDRDQWDTNLNRVQS